MMKKTTLSLTIFHYGDPVIEKMIEETARKFKKSIQDAESPGINSVDPTNPKSGIGVEASLQTEDITFGEYLEALGRNMN